MRQTFSEFVILYLILMLPESITAYYLQGIYNYKNLQNADCNNEVRIQKRS